MDKLKGVAKGGWHPEGKGGGKESWRGDFKGINQVAGWMGKGKDTSKGAEVNEHRARPLTSLRDPATFAPPPRRVTGLDTSSASNALTSDRRALGAPLSQGQVQVNQEQEVGSVAIEEESTLPPPPPPSYRANTTGWTTDHLPKPPVRSLDQGRSAAPQAPPGQQKTKPALPPRLPPRQNSNALQPAVSSPPPSYTERGEVAPVQNSYLNHGSQSRLGSAGISVPGLNIGQSTNPRQSRPLKNPQLRHQKAPSS